MTITWITPAALIGIALVALPIAVHLLVRQHARVLAFPSLRFLRQTQLAALRRRTIQDAALLTCRMAIVAIAALALAGPVFQTAGRMTAHAKRTSRAIVPIGVSDERAIASVAEGAMTSATFTRTNVADALGDAARWLNLQPPSAREIVVIGDLRRGAIVESDLAFVPPEIGLRFVPLAASPPVEQVMSILARRDGVLTRIDRRVRLDNDETGVSETGRAPVSSGLVAIVAAPQDAALAEASLRAALDAGIPWSDFSRPVLILWDGATPPSNTGDSTILRMAVPSPPGSAADAVRELLARASSTQLKEPMAIDAARLARWTRSPGPPASNAPLVDEGDRRWLWAAALALIALEWLLRRSASVAKPATSAAVEADVA